MKQTLLSIVVVLVCAFNMFAQGTLSLRSVDDGGAGSFRAVITEHEAFPGFTVYRPNLLQTAAQKTTLPLIVFASGGCMNTSVPFDKFLTEISSFGYIVVAVGPYVDDPEEAFQEETSLLHTDWHQLLRAVDIMDSLSRTPGNEFYNIVDMKHVAVMGQSCGGLQALACSYDPRITTTVLLNSGVITPTAEQTERITDFVVDKSVLSTLHAPILYLVGGEEDQAYPNAHDDFERIGEDVFVAMGTFPSGHSGTYADTFGGTYAILATQWFEWQLKEKPWSRKVFTGEECICVFSGWDMARKNEKLVIE